MRIASLRSSPVSPGVLAVLVFTLIGCSTTDRIVIDRGEPKVVFIIVDGIPADVLEKAKVLVINYPNNPTGASATKAFFEDVVAWAKKNNIIVVHDAAYGALVFDGNPLSFLSVPGAKDVGVELHSTSKAFNMTGWRCGFVAGNELLVKAYGDVKDNTDSGQFLAIQHAAAYCWNHPEITEKIADKYSRRMDGLVEVLRSAGLDAVKPGGSFFLYLPSPKPRSNQTGRASNLKMVRRLLNG